MSLKTVLLVLAVSACGVVAHAENALFTVYAGWQSCGPNSLGCASSPQREETVAIPLAFGKWEKTTDIGGILFHYSIQITHDQPSDGGARGNPYSVLASIQTFVSGQDEAMETQQNISVDALDAFSEIQLDGAPITHPDGGRVLAKLRIWPGPG